MSFLRYALIWPAFFCCPCIGNASGVATDPVQVLYRDSIKLDDLLNSVEQHYPVIMASLQDVQKAESDLLMARGGFDPVLKSSAQTTPSGEYSNRTFDTLLEQPTPFWGTRIVAGYRKGSGEFGPYDEKLKTNSAGEVRGGVEVPLLRGGVIDERRAKIGVAEKSKIAVDYSLRMQKLDASRQAVSRYFEWIAAHEKLQIARDMLKLARERDEATRKRVHRGDAAVIDQVDNERSVLQRETAVVAAMRSVNKASLELSMFLRDNAGAPIVPSGPAYDKKILALSNGEIQKGLDLTKVSFSDTDLTAYPEVRRSKALLEQSEIEIQYAENQFLPKVDAEVLVSQDYGDGSLKKEKMEYKVGVKVELPLRMRSQNGRLNGVIANRNKIDAQLGLAKDRLNILLNDFRQSIDASRQRTELIQREVQLSAKVEEAERLRFRHGDSNLLMVNIREQTTADAEQRLVDAKIELLRALTEFELIRKAMQG